MDKIYTFPNTEETRDIAIKTLENMLNAHQGTLLGHIFPLFVMPTLFTETDMNKVLERLHFINKVLAESLRKLRKIKHLPKREKQHIKQFVKTVLKETDNNKTQAYLVWVIFYKLFCNSPKNFVYSHQNL